MDPRHPTGLGAGYLHEYLGDGAYVYIDTSGDFVVCASDGSRETNRVVLGFWEVKLLKDWLIKAAEFISASPRGGR